MKSFIKANLRVLPMTILFCTISVYAAGAINSNDIVYCPGNENLQAATVSDALDLLYARVDNVPIGTIIPYMGTTAPANYLICNGSTYNIADYPDLAEHIKKDFGSYNKFGGDGTTTFKVPDLRGEFLRGTGTNSHTGQGNGSPVGTHQDASEHPYLFSDENYVNAGIFNGNSIQKDSSHRVGTSKIGYAKLTRGSWTQTYDVYTSRPTNTSVNYLIKAK